MSLVLDVKSTLPLCYEFLRSTPPFKSWGLPPAAEVEFRVTRQGHCFGTHTTYVRTKDHVIEISEKRVGHTRTLIETMAHEMIHQAQAEEGTNTPGSEHNSDFMRRWRLVARYHGFDPKSR